MNAGAAGSDTTGGSVSGLTGGGSGGVMSPPASSRNAMSYTLRRRRSKGTIAGFATGPNGEMNKMNGESGGPVGDNASPVGGGGPQGMGQGAQPQHLSDGPPVAPARPCHSARMALLCCQNALRMGARTQLGLCPPGQTRRSLQTALHQNRARRKKGSQPGGGLSRPSLLTRASSIGSSLSQGRHGEPELNAYYALDKMIGEKNLLEYEARDEEFLLRFNPNGYEIEEDNEFVEDASSGDEEDLASMEDLLAEDGCGGSMTSPTAVVDLDLGAKKYEQLREPLFTPTGQEPGGSNPSGASLGGMGSAGSGKLPFNYRKIRWFDAVTAADRAVARQYLKEEMQKAKKRDGFVLARHLRRMQRRERRRTMFERGEKNHENTDDVYSDEENEDLMMEQLGISFGVGRFGHTMTPSLSAALLLESLSLNVLESVEGMAKCYDGIVAAGVALLDSEMDDSTKLEVKEEKKRPSRSEIMTALAPLLVTKLEQPSGEVILCLARLRRMCGTARYQRRFVQRIAPCLIRPPNGAMWCLRHQNDIEPILAAAEMILDAAFDVFSTGWYERGRLLLADSVRAETLNTAAMQLKRLSAAVPGESLSLGLNTPGSGHGHRRGSSLMIGSTPTKDGGSSSSSEALTEWEVLAVDRQIRKSISDIFTRDWSKVVLVSPKDHEHTRPHRRGISSTAGGTAKSRTASSSESQAAEGKAVASPSAAASPISPPRASVKVPLSPPHPPPPPVQASGENMEDTYNSSLLSSAGATTVQSPPPPGSVATPLSPHSSRRHVTDEMETVSGGRGVGTNKDVIGSSSVNAPQTPQPQHHVVRTPPRSPSSPPRGAGSSVNQTALSGTGSTSGLQSPIATLASPSGSNRAETSTPPLGQQPSGSDGFLLQAPQMPLMSPTHSSAAAIRASEARSPDVRAPLSPGNASLASVASEDSSRHRLVSSSAAPSASSAQSAHYRMLTSTAAERKRTVAACRALRAQITRFEEAFIQLHGRPPKGAAERAPLATTYAQYREWKRAIRADAACRIQALFRGARTRWMLLRSNNPRMSRIIMKRAGRPGYGSVQSGSQLQGGERENVLKQLSIPVEIGGSDSEQSHHGSRGHSTIHGSSGGFVARVPSPASQQLDHSDESSEVSNMGVEVFISPPGAVPSPSLSPNWTTTSALSVQRRRSGSGDNRYKAGRGSLAEDSATGLGAGVTAGPQHFQSSPGGPAGGAANLSELSLQELQSRKRELKQQLKQYDMNFARQHGRMPVKAEKEPIRHLYETYNALKSQISLLEREGQQIPGNSYSYRRSSSATMSTGSATSSGADSSGDDSPTNATPPSVARPKRKDKSGGSVGGKISSTITPSGAPSQDLAALKAEKGTLHQMLRSYEKDFFKEHKRQVSSFADIRPVASQYRRYKEIKKAIAALQQAAGEK